jgi:hypothetical protein
MGLGKRSETSLELGRGARGAARLRPLAASGASSPSDERDGERGSILLLFALFITLFALLCAVVVDVGYWWVIGKKAQVAADACALAAAGQLPANWTPPRTECMVAGVDYARTNLPLEGLANEPRHTGTLVTSPYASVGGGDPATYVEAKVTMVVRTFFGRVVGLDHISLTRRAVAEQSGGAGNYAIYSHSADCSEGLEFNGNVHSIDGRVHSNGEYLVNNGGTQPFWAKVGTTAKPSCTHLQPSGAVRFGGSSWSTSATTTADQVAAQAWPEWFTPADFGWRTCSGANFSGQKIEIDDTTLKVTGRPDRTLQVVNGRRVIPSGTYCATELFKIGGNNLDGDITALAPKIEVAGNGHRLTPFAANDVLFFNVPNTDLNTGNDGAPGGTGPLTCSSTEEMKLYNGNSGSWEGKVFHPCGRVLIDGDGTRTLKGAIYALRVRVNGNNFTMIGTGAGGATKNVALVE